MFVAEVTKLFVRVKNWLDEIFSSNNTGTENTTTRDTANDHDVTNLNASPYKILRAENNDRAEGQPQLDQSNAYIMRNNNFG